ncbi:hypothetical protein [Arthrobacter sp. UYCo732]|uniref:hypothetical protein n=1 Tax=Arthrobacter sp. UYCo732 TaxID=3156336 RepID=UPI00339B1917
MTTATATTASPLATFQEGRNAILTSILGSVAGLEGSVLEFQNAHEGEVRAVRFELSEAVREQKRLESLVGDQALELDSARKHICAVPAPATDSFGFDLEVPAPAAADPAPAPAPAPEGEDTTPTAAVTETDATDRTIEELRSGMEELRRTNETLSADLRAEQGTTADLRLKLEERDRRIETLQDESAAAGRNLTAAEEKHQDYARDAEKSFDERLATGVRTAQNGVRAEAVRIIEAIAADNPDLAEAADLFTVAFPAETDAAPEAHAPVPVRASVVDVPDEAPAAAGDVFQGIQTAEQEAPTAAASEDDFLQALPTDDADGVPEPLTQNYLPAPDLTDDAILDPNFFDTPPALGDVAFDAPAPEEKQAEAPKPGYGLFGRKKEDSNA